MVDALEFDLTRDDSDPPSDDMKSSPVLVVGSSAAEVNPEPIHPTHPLPSPESGGEHQAHADAGVVAVRMEDSNGLPPDRVHRLSLFSGVP